MYKALLTNEEQVKLSSNKEKIHSHCMIMYDTLRFLNNMFLFLTTSLASFVE